MSDWYFDFDITCPKCKNVEHAYDGFSTDDWYEVFVFSGYTKNSCSNKNSYNGNYKCPKCCAETPVDNLYRNKFIKVYSIEKLKDYLKLLFKNYLNDIITNQFGDHGWYPDMDAVLYRYCLLFPQDKELLELKERYDKAIYSLHKFSPPDGTTIIYPRMIPNKSILNKVYLPDSLLAIDSDTFSNCLELRDIFIPKSVRRIGSRAFYGCHNLVTVHSSDCLMTIECNAFAQCSHLVNFFFPNSLAIIESYSFSYCESLTKIYIPYSCTFIGEGAFKGCRNIKKAIIPKHLKNVEFWLDKDIPYEFY